MKEYINNTNCNYLYLYNNPNNKNDRYQYVYFHLINKSTVLLGCINVILSKQNQKDKCLKQFLLILKKFKIKTVILDCHTTYITFIEKELGKESFISNNYISTNNSRMSIVHIDLTKIK